MTNIINAKRINQITIIEIFSAIIRTQNISIIQDFNQVFIHSSEDKIFNYENLEFFGDAVLRLAASNFIEKKYPQMSVGESSELRAQIVSDEWLTKLGGEINIEKLIIKGPKALGDENSKNTIIGEATEALIGAVYKCFNSIQEVNLWLDDIWEKDSEIFLKLHINSNPKHYCKSGVKVKVVICQFIK